MNLYEFKTHDIYVDGMGYPIFKKSMLDDVG